MGTEGGTCAGKVKQDRARVVRTATALSGRLARKPLTKGIEMERQWTLSAGEATVDAAGQDSIECGDVVRSYDFPGLDSGCYVEGVVTERDDEAVMIHVIRDVWANKDEQVGARLQVCAPLGISSSRGVPAVYLIAKRVKKSDE